MSAGAAEQGAGSQCCSMPLNEHGRLGLVLFPDIRSLSVKQTPTPWKHLKHTGVLFCAAKSVINDRLTIFKTFRGGWLNLE